MEKEEDDGNSEKTLRHTQRNGNKLQEKERPSGTDQNDRDLVLLIATFHFNYLFISLF